MAIPYLSDHPEKIDWSKFITTRNSDEMICFIERNVIIDPRNFWHEISMNPHAIRLIKRNLDKISWHCLSNNNNNNFSGLENNLDKFNWSHLSGNIYVIPILGKNLNKTHRNYLSRNPMVISFSEQKPREY